MKGQMTAFEKWKGFIEQLIYFECPADNEKSRLQAELALIEKDKQRGSVSSDLRRVAFTHNKWNSQLYHGRGGRMLHFLFFGYGA